MQRPNIVVVYVDDLGYGDLGCFGASDLLTPNIDALAARGILFEQCYSNSPVCSPSRAALLTGQHPAHAGVDGILGGERRATGLQHQPTLASRLHDQGYATGIFGKWHLGMDESSHPSRLGFDEFFGIRAGCVDYYSHIYYWGNRNPTHDLWEGDEEVWRNGEYLTEAITSRAVEYIRKHRRSPFFCYVPYNAPHYPMHAPKRYLDRFEGLDPERRIMAAMIAAIDDGVGEIVRALDELGLLEGTIILFSSDNGPSAEDRNWLGGEEIAYKGGSTGGLRGAKGSLYEGGIRVPTILSWPDGLPQNRQISQLVQISDFAPTLLAACFGNEAYPPEDFDGMNVLDGLKGASSPVERSLFWEYESQSAARIGDWKIVRNPTERLGAESENADALFFLGEHGSEYIDLKDSQPGIFAEMEHSLQLWEAKVQHWRTANASNP